MDRVLLPVVVGVYRRLDILRAQLQVLGRGLELKLWPKLLEVILDQLKHAFGSRYFVVLVFPLS